MYIYLLLLNQLKTVTRSRLRLKRLHTESPPISEPRISRGHVIKGSCDNIGSSRSREVIILPSLVAIGTLVIVILWFLFVTWSCKTTWSGRCVTLRLGAFKISYHPTKICGHRHCGSEDIMVLARHVIRGSCDFTGSSPLRWATILPSSVIIAALVVEL